MHIGIYINNENISSVDCKNLLVGNPGIGGTEYCVLLLAQAYKMYYSNNKVTLFVAKQGILPEVDNYVVVNGIDDLPAKAQKEDVDVLVVSAVYNGIPLPQSFFDDISAKKIKTILWGHNFYLSNFCDKICKCEYAKANVFVGRQQYDRYVDHAVINKSKVYQASTSELYGKVEEVPQKETTPFHPYSPYAVAKQYGFWMVKEYRDAYGMFAVNGILFNHESERRGENFVTRKITLAAGRIAEGLQDHLELGNMDSLRDWGYAKDYVECMWLIMQQENPEDFVIATGVQHTVRDFTEKAFAANGMTIRWEGTGINEKGYDAATGKLLVCVNPQWFRPTDVDNLWGDPTKAKTVLGWNPQKTSYEELVEIMAKHDRELAKREKAMKAVM